MSIDKRLLGKRLYVDIHPEKEEGEEFAKTEGGLYMPSEESKKGIRQYRTCTVIQVGDEISDIFAPGNKLRLVANGRESKFKVDGKTFHMIPSQDVISIIE